MTIEISEETPRVVLPEETEDVEVTPALFELLLKYTGGDVELQTPKTRHFVQALHAAIYGSGRWYMQLTRDDVEAVHYILRVASMRREHTRTLHHNAMIKQSLIYQHLASEARHG
jgi:hypothetical protein